MTSPDSALVFSPILLALGLAMIVVGLIAWSGRIRAIMLRSWPSRTLHLAPLYLGIALVLTTLSPLVGPVVGMVMLVVALVAFALGVLAVWWLPRPLTPRWLRDAPSWKDPHEHS